ncbi:thiamine-phosphate pyrophosphorylase [Clostridium pascui]|uniref:thiamine phosphate synthase n=1 Tax=Clostridium pascui TaxID=46609 RepID=UPI001956A98B|nr:thiamine phosphate synthase [Clostridium pascui]MBM7869771.1 thiamine-phosphate pyrophosphorylase [Clostridium pascui]
MLICLTNRKLCTDDFFNRMNEIAKGKPHAIMLREKDLSLEEYKCLAIKAKEICDINEVPLIINKNIEVASKLKLPNIHLSMPDLRAHKNELHQFTNIGASVHSLLEAKEAEDLGASYLIAGHIFSTDCKKGVPPRGLSFLKEVCDCTSIPVFAIGGITKDKVKDVINAGAAGMCIMSEAMTCPNPVELSDSFTI